MKYKMSVKISFMHYMKQTRVMLAVVLEEFILCFIFLLLHFLLLLSFGKRSTKEHLLQFTNLM